MGPERVQRPHPSVSGGDGEPRRARGAMHPAGPPRALARTPCLCARHAAPLAPTHAAPTLPPALSCHPAAARSSRRTTPTTTSWGTTARSRCELRAPPRPLAERRGRRPPPPCCTALRAGQRPPPPHAPQLRLPGPHRRLTFLLRPPRKPPPPQVGILPVAFFCSGHVYFTQKMHKTLGIQPYAVHATFQFSGTPGKRHRFRDAGLWLEEDSYFHPPGGGRAGAQPQGRRLPVQTVPGPSPPTPPSPGRGQTHTPLPSPQLLART
jgi:hypothetical protein